MLWQQLFDQIVMEIKLHWTELKWIESGKGCLSSVYEVKLMWAIHFLVKGVAWVNVGGKTEKEGERQSEWGSVRVKKIHKNTQTERERWGERERERERLYPTSEVSILISTISHCSLAAGQIDRDARLSKTPGNKKHRGTNRLKLAASPKTSKQWPLSFLSCTGTQSNKYNTREEETHRRTLLPDWHVFSFKLSFSLTTHFTKSTLFCL